MNMTLREQQSIFMKLFDQLIAWAYANGYELTASGGKGFVGGWTVSYPLD